MSFYGRYEYVDKATNSSKYYSIAPHPSDKNLCITAYGRIGSTPTVSEEPIGKIQKAIDLKIKKGYKPLTVAYYLQATEAQALKRRNNVTTEVYRALTTSQSSTSSKGPPPKAKVVDTFSQVLASAKSKKETDYFDDLNSF